VTPIGPWFGRACRSGRGVGRRWVAGALALAASLALVPATTSAQGLVGAGSGKGPLQIDAQDGIEWRRDEQVYIARGDARARRGDVTVYGERLIAHYREKENAGAGPDGDGEDEKTGGLSGGSTEIYRIEAVGDVRIVDDRSTSSGDKAVYDLDQQVVVLTGDDLKFETEQETITAEDSLEYWQARDMAVARGDAVATREERVLRADVLTAHFTEQDSGEDGNDGASAETGGQQADADGEADPREQNIRRIEAFRNVRISTPEEFARGDRGVYNTRTEIATLTGDVRLTRGDNQLNGGWGQVNLKTGVSRLRPAPPDAGSERRVRALLQPDSADDVEPSETAEREATGAAEGGGNTGSGANAASGGDTEGGGAQASEGQ
jgi:lipopolysaccharide export system protein LptA